MSEYNETGTPPHHIPTFQSREELAEFWDTHSFTDYLEDLEPAKAEIAEIVTALTATAALNRVETSSSAAHSVHP